MGMLEGKVAIITGGAKGMGEATAKLFAENGAKVVIADIDVPGGERVTEEIKAAGGEAAFVRADISKGDEVKAMVDFAVETYGELNVAVNNAAKIPDDKPFGEMADEDIDALFDIDLKGNILCLKYELIQMEKQGKGGAIVNISSISGIRPQPANPLYVTAKHGIIGATKTAAMDYSPKGIRINSIAPGAVDTPMLREALEHFNLEPVSYAKQLSLLGRFADPREIAQGTMWLCSDAASFVTGQVLAVDGGYTAM